MELFISKLPNVSRISVSSFQTQKSEFLITTLKKCRGIFSKSRRLTFHFASFGLALYLCQSVFYLVYLSLFPLRDSKCTFLLLNYHQAIEPKQKGTSMPVAINCSTVLRTLVHIACSKCLSFLLKKKWSLCILVNKSIN